MSRSTETTSSMKSFIFANLFIIILVLRCMVENSVNVFSLLMIDPFTEHKFGTGSGSWDFGVS